jgi:hypothetical protein
MTYARMEWVRAVNDVPVGIRTMLVRNDFQVVPQLGLSLKSVSG